MVYILFKKRIFGSDKLRGAFSSKEAMLNWAGRLADLKRNKEYIVVCGSDGKPVETYDDMWAFITYAE